MLYDFMKENGEEVSPIQDGGTMRLFDLMDSFGNPLEFMTFSVVDFKMNEVLIGY